ncbi:MAG: tRNA 4-thiouridine(8) synthase ThiI [Tissierellia bacterium]|nr:tRNA 4-thiouridine(8) synthase ThiI [Tissierellia bacterium]
MSLTHVLSVSFGELTLKGANRNQFEKTAIRRVIDALKPWPFEQLYKEQGKFYIEADPAQFPAMIDAVKKVFGIHQVSPAVRVEKEMTAIREAVLYVCREREAKQTVRTFKAETRRTDKRFPMTSPEMNREIGGWVLDATDWTVDVHAPDVYVYVDVRDSVYVYTEKIRGYAGLPVGSSGRGLLLLSGGIDSPVAGFLMARRGMQVDALHFHSYPFTGERSEEKVKKLARILSRFTGPMRFTSVNLLPMQQAIRENCSEREMTILSRRFMMRIAEKIADRDNRQALITGESLGQVASQTVESMHVIDRVTDRLIIRPLVGLDKEEITRWSVEIGTYETSILPFEDCCTVFLPAHPLTKPHLDAIEASEQKMDIETLVQSAVENAITTKIA